LSNRNFTDEEFMVAGIGGLGLLLMILGGLTLGFGTNDGGDAQLFLFSGAFLMILAIVLWLFIARPWESYDDLQTPYYTGHDHHDDEHAVVVAEPAEVVPVATEADTATDMKDVEEAIEMVDEAEAGEVAEVAEEVIEEAVQPETPVEIKEVAAAEGDADETPDDDVILPEKATEEQVEEAVEDEIEEETAAVPEPSGEPEDLRAIQGIGPKTQDALYAEGITTYAQLAALSAEELETVVKEKHGVRIRSGATESWPKQAQFLVDGDTDGLETYQKTL
jgi:predicted flap endonuclease-1-like 5' DNA nuclease